jgi:holo-[acyl-carrier protein] synthase
MEPVSMQIRGIGNDIIEINRIRNSLTRYQQHFLNKIYTTGEQEHCFTRQDPVPGLAGRFAAKEAIAKALGTGIGAKLSWLDIEILNSPEGKPYPVFSSKIIDTFDDPQVLLTISHCREYAMATAVYL